MLSLPCRQHPLCRGGRRPARRRAGPAQDGGDHRRIRASDHPDHDVPIFAVTANTFAADRKKCYDAGMSGYIPKPIDLETITHVLEEETGE